jgi:bilin biosynthesis protein
VNSQVESEGNECIQLSEAEASALASHLKEKLKSGVSIESDPASISKMVAGLGDPRGLLRRSFSESLGSIGKVATPALCKAMLTSDQVTVRRAAAKTLTLIGDTASLPDLLSAFLGDEDSVVQGSAMGAIAAMGEQAVEPILSIIENPKSTEMQIGLANWALTIIGDRAPQALHEATTSTNANVRKASIFALASNIQTLDIEADKNLLINALSDPYAEIRAEAVTLLGKLDDMDNAGPLLIPLLSDSDIWVRKNSALSLMKLRATSSLNALQERAKVEDDAIVLNVVKLAIAQLLKAEQSN